MMESPDDASEMACPMVLQAVCADMQLLSSLPFAPSVYHVLARATGVTDTMKVSNHNVEGLVLIALLLMESAYSRDGHMGDPNLRFNAVRAAASDVRKGTASGAELRLADDICAAGISRHDTSRCKEGKGKITDANPGPAVISDRV